MLKIFISFFLITSFASTKNLSKEQIKNIILNSSKYKNSKYTSVNKKSRRKSTQKKYVKTTKKTDVKILPRGDKISKGIPYQLFTSLSDKKGNIIEFKKGFVLIKGEDKIKNISQKEKTEEQLLKNLL